MEVTENMVEFITGQRTCVVTFSNPKHINKMKKLYEEHKEDFKYFVENNDGTICVKIPLKRLKISPPRKMSEEQKLAASERFKQMRVDGKL